MLMPLLQLATFIQTDIDLLSERYDVRVVRCRSPLEVVRTCAEVVAADCVVCWFASIWFLPIVTIARLLRRPVAVICGGYDVASVPEIEYGNMRKPLPRFLGRLVLRAASVVIPFSQSATREALDNAGVSSHKIKTVCLGVNDSIGHDSVGMQKRPTVLTVSITDESTLKRKGLETLAAVSRLMPEVEFLVVGRTDATTVARLRSLAGPNVRFTGFVDDSTLQQLMRTSKVVFQPSVHEGFGMAVAEAMLHGAIPVVSSRFSLPEVVGDTGFYGSPDEPQSFVSGLQSALRAPVQAAAAARNRIVRHFPLEKRRSQLLSLMESICPTRSFGVCQRQSLPRNAEDSNVDR